MGKQDELETQNLYEAAYCLLKGMELRGKKRGESGKIMVVMAGKDIQKVAAEYFNGKSVDAKKFSECLKSVKEYALSYSN